MFEFPYIKTLLITAMTAYVINLNDEEKKETKSRVCSPRKPFLVIFVTLLIILATFRIWLATYSVTAPAPLRN